MEIEKFKRLVFYDLAFQTNTSIGVTRLGTDGKEGDYRGRRGTVICVFGNVAL